MKLFARRANARRLLVMAALVLIASAAYMLVDARWGNEKLFACAMKIRTPKLVAMLITAFAIGGASIVFQSIINNTIVTPCLLGMNSLYTLIHTAVVFVAGSGSLLATNPNAAFAVDLVLMGAAATVIYSYLFQKTNHNVLYVLLIGTVLTSFFGSIQTTLTRVMDPNEYDSLLSTLVASFSNINSEIIVFSVIVLTAVIFALRRELDVISCGDIEPLDKNHPSVFAYRRTYGDQELIVAANFYGRDCEWKGAPCLDGFSKVLGNYAGETKEEDGALQLKPYEAAVWYRETEE